MHSTLADTQLVQLGVRPSHRILRTLQRRQAYGIGMLETNTTSELRADAARNQTTHDEDSGRSWLRRHFLRLPRTLPVHLQLPEDLIRW
jgi:hypothetical protein